MESYPIFNLLTGLVYKEKITRTAVYNSHLQIQNLSGKVDTKAPKINPSITGSIYLTDDESGDTQSFKYSDAGEFQFSAPIAATGIRIDGQTQLNGKTEINNDLEVNNINISENLSVNQNIKANGDISGNNLYINNLINTKKLQNGIECKATGLGSHAEGLGTISQYNYQHVAGKYNTPEDKAYIIGGGSSNNDRKNIFTVDWDGNLYTSGIISAGGFAGLETSGTTVINNNMFIDKSLVVASTFIGGGSMIMATDPSSVIDYIKGYYYNYMRVLLKDKPEDYLSAGYGERLECYGHYYNYITPLIAGQPQNLISANYQNSELYQSISASLTNDSLTGIYLHLTNTQIDFNTALANQLLPSSNFYTDSVTVNYTLNNQINIFHNNTWINAGIITKIDKNRILLTNLSNQFKKVLLKNIKTNLNYGWIENANETINRYSLYSLNNIKSGNTKVRYFDYLNPDDISGYYLYLTDQQSSFSGIIPNQKNYPASHFYDPSYEIDYINDDIINIVNAAHTPRCGKITLIDGNKLLISQLNPSIKEELCIYTNYFPAGASTEFGAYQYGLRDSFDIDISDYSICVDEKCTSGKFPVAENQAYIFGNNNSAGGKYIYIRGGDNQMFGDYSTAIGYGNIGHGYGNLLVGPNNYSEGIYCIAIGYETSSFAQYGISLGKRTSIYGIASMANGMQSIASGDYTHAEGRLTQAIGKGSHAEGVETITNGNYSHAEGYQTIANGNYSHAEGKNTTTDADYQFVIGQYNEAKSNQAFIIGGGNSTNRKNIYEIDLKGNSYQQGIISASKFYDTLNNNTIDKLYLPKSNPVAIGTLTNGKFDCEAIGDYSHAEGQGSKAYTRFSHAEGNGTNTGTSDMSPSTGNGGQHAEGYKSIAIGAYSHAEGENTVTYSIDSHTEGDSTSAFTAGSHVEGLGTLTFKPNASNYNNKNGSYAYQHIEGKWNDNTNIRSMQYVVGGGTSDNDRKNIYTRDWNGNVWTSGNISSNDLILSGLDSSMIQSLEKLSASIEVKMPVGNYLSSVNPTGIGTFNITTVSANNIYANGKNILSEFVTISGNIISAVNDTRDNLNIRMTTLQTGYKIADQILSGKIDTISGQLSAKLDKNNPTGTGTLTINNIQAGNNCNAIGNYSFANGNNVTAQGLESHAEGDNTFAYAAGSHVEGYGTKSWNPSDKTLKTGVYSFQHVEGKWNSTLEPDLKAMQYVVGGGTSNNDRKTIYKRDWYGNVWTSGVISAAGLNVDNAQMTDLTLHGNLYGQDVIATLWSLQVVDGGNGIHSYGDIRTNGNVKSNDQYLNARRYNATITGSSYSVSYNNGDFFTLTTNVATQLLVTDIPLGCAIVVRLTVSSNVNITFGGTTIISSAGTYYITFTNPNGTIEMVGSAISL